MVHFYVLRGKNILTKLVDNQQPTFLCFKMEFVVGTISLSKARAGLKPMHPMQLHYALRLWRPRPMVVGHVVHFCQVILALKNYRNGFQISLLENSYLV